MRKLFTGLVFTALLAGTAQAQTVPLKSFAYLSNGCSSGFLYFGGNWQLTPANPAGSGSFPSGDFWIRAISLTYFSDAPVGSDWAIVGHSGANGDWLTPPALSDETVKFVYPADAAPLFTAGEYLDVHASACAYNEVAAVAVWYVPAP